MPLFTPTPRPPPDAAPPSITETPDQYAMGPKPPPVTFDMLEDLARVCASIKAMAERGASQADDQSARRLSRLMHIEREMRYLIHDDMLLRRGASRDELTLFPAYRTVGDMRMIVQDLQVVWNGAEWVGDGACTFNRCRIDNLEKTDSPAYEIPWPKSMLILHSSINDYRVGEMPGSGRQYVPPNQSMHFAKLKVGDYLMGELYVEVC